MTSRGTSTCDTTVKDVALEIALQKSGELNFYNADSEITTLKNRPFHMNFPKVASEIGTDRLEELDFYRSISYCKLN